MKDETNQVSDSSFRLHPSSFGRPYFVMELVHGVPITKYCDDNHLTPRERLELFVPVCQAIQHAHQKGIIHRDIKPSNVMVTLYDGKPVPKVIDFGVAKATEQKLTERTLFTQYGTMVGTLEYMSPEQAEMSALGVDTRSDIYSLGVLLYELLTGSTPLTRQRFKDAAYGEILRIIKEDEPPKPSTRLSDSGEALASISANRQTEPAKLTKLVRGELDWIVMKCLEKDRNRRYETANGFGADVQRYLADEPVLAGPPSATYRMRKFLRRNKRALAVAGLALFFLVLVGGILGWTLRDRAARQLVVEQKTIRALEETEEAYKHDRLAEAIAAVQRAEALASDGVDEPMRQRVRQWRANLKTVAQLQEIRLQRAAVKDGYFDSRSTDAAYRDMFREHGLDVEALSVDEAAQLVRASPIKNQLLAALDDWWGTRRSGIGRHKLLAIARRADDDAWPNRLRDVLLSADKKVWQELKSLARDEEVLAQPPATLVLLGRGLTATDQLSLAIELLRLAQRRRPDDFWINHYLASNLMDLQPPKAEDAVRFYQAALALRPQSAGVHYNLGRALYVQGRLEEAIAAYHEALKIHKDYAQVHNNLGVALYAQGHEEEAIKSWQDAIRLNLNHAEPYRNLGAALYRKGQMERAIDAHREAIRLKPGYAEAHAHLGAILCDDKKDYDEAIICFKKAIRLEPGAAHHHYNLGNALRGKELWADAIDAYREAIRIKPDHANAQYHLGVILGEQKKDYDGAVMCLSEVIRQHPDNWKARQLLGVVFRNMGRHTDALKTHEETLERQKAKLGPDDLETLGSMYNVALSYTQLGRYADALKLNEEVLTVRKAKLGANHPDTLWSMNNVASNYGELGRHADAYKLHEETFTLRKATLGHDHPDTLTTMYNLGLCCSMLGRNTDAVKLGEETLALREAKLGLDHRDTLRSMHNLAESYRALRRLPEAVKLHEETLSHQRAKLGPDHGDTLVSMNNLGLTYEFLGRHEEALKLREETLALWKVKSGDDHPETLRSMNNVAASYYALGRYEDALKLYEKTLTLRKAKLGPDHPDTLRSMWSAAQALLKVERGVEAIPLIDECVARSAGKKVDPRMIPIVIELRLRHFQKNKDAAGCRATAEMWEKLKRTDAVSLYNAACYRAVGVSVLRAFDKSESAAKDAAAEADRAMAMLRKAVAAGFNDVAHMRADRDLHVLRDRDDYKELLGEISKAKK
jgi:eukaryotic-like serine/threonine-protein kinase